MGFSVFRTPLDDWVNVDVIYSRVVSVHGFSSVGSWSYPKESVWKLGTKCMLHCFRKVNYQQGDTPGI